MIDTTIDVINKLGLHARASDEEKAREEIQTLFAAKFYEAE